VARRPAVSLLVAVALVAVPIGDAAPADAATACRAGYVALTFDDGPSTKHTGTVLDVLAHRHVPATFFVVGELVAARPALVARTAAEGHAVANHTYRHEKLTTLDDDAIRHTVDRTDRAIRSVGVAPLKLVRPPYGATSTRVRSALGAGGYGHILWTVDPQDWRNDRGHIRSFVLGNLAPGAVILLHDGLANTPETIAALPGIIDGARDRGYCFATLDDHGRLVPPQVDWRDHGGPFRDVPPTSTHADAIARLVSLGITKGCGDDRYCPDTAVSRAQMASFLQRTLGLPDGPTGGFVDVPSGSTHAAAIGALAAAGITTGCTADGRSYCPNESIRRDQMASLLQRALALAPGADDRFRDVVPGSTHAAAIGAVADAGITRGCSDDGRSFCPGASVSRAQMASFLVRTVDHLAS
jgi:peptidoglycan/xylan/chitin deacetylase (PgdA/CDA1 family)